MTLDRRNDWKPCHEQLRLRIDVSKLAGGQLLNIEVTLEFTMI